MLGSAQTHSLVLQINHHCLTISSSKLLLLANNSGGGTSDSYDNIAGADDDNWASGKPKSRFSQVLICLLIIKVYFISRGQKTTTFFTAKLNKTGSNKTNIAVSLKYSFK